MSNSSLTIFLMIFAWSIVALWLAALFWTWFCLNKQKPLALNKMPKVERKPLVSILVPARNEANRVLEKSLRSILNQTYRNFD